MKSFINEINQAYNKAMSRNPDRYTFINSVRKEREAWQASWEALDEKQMVQSDAVGEWTVKDIIAHVVWHEREMCEMIRWRDFLKGSELWNLPTDERNAEIYKLNRDRSLADVLKEAKEVYAVLLEQLETLSDEDLQAPSHFAGMPSNWEPWNIIAGNTYAHYLEHIVKK